MFSFFLMHQGQIVLWDVEWCFRGASTLSCRFKVSSWCGDVIADTLCGSGCCNKAAVHNYNRWLESFSSKNPLRFGAVSDAVTKWHWKSHVFFPPKNTLSQILSVVHSGLYFFSLPLWCLPFHWLCLMQDCVFLCLTLARGNNTSHWMVVCSGAFSDIQSLLF